MKRTVGRVRERGEPRANWNISFKRGHEKKRGKQRYKLSNVTNRNKREREGRERIYFISPWSIVTYVEINLKSQKILIFCEGDTRTCEDYHIIFVVIVRCTSLMHFLSNRYAYSFRPAWKFKKIVIKNKWRALRNVRPASRITNERKSISRSKIVGAFVEID